MRYSVDASVPPKFTERENPVYTAQARLFVTSGEAPYLRTSVPRVREVPIGTNNTEATFTRVNEAPDVSTLVDAANLFPLLIESDDVARVRSEQQSGDLPGEVAAKAIFATATANRFQPSGIPVIELFATADSPDHAVNLATATSRAFRTWIVREQNRAGIDKKDRILIQELEAPRGAIATGGAGLGLPVLALLAIITAFGAAAIMLDRTFPRPESDEDTTSSEMAAAARAG